MAKSKNSLLEIVDSYRAAHKRLLLLDYDGTLAPFDVQPDQAKPSAQALSVLNRLAQDKRNTVIVISGRGKDTLDNWLGHLPLQLIAEHGAFEKRGGQWFTLVSSSPSWKKIVRPSMQSYLPKIPGSSLEDKEHSLVFHYRGAKDPAQAKVFAKSLASDIRPMFTRLELDMTDDNLTLEVRKLGTDKGKIALKKLGEGTYDFVLCAGDGQTDEDMFAAMDGKSFSIKIGRGKTIAGYKVKNPAEFIEFLEALA